MKTNKFFGVLAVVLVMMVMFVVKAGAQTKEAYAVFDENDSTLTLYYDANKPEGAYGLRKIENQEKDNWKDIKFKIKKVVFSHSFSDYRPTTCASWFDNCVNLIEIEGMNDNLNTENVKTMGEMFSMCTNLNSLDLSNFNTKNVTNMYAMFSGCSSLTSIDLSSFNTYKVSSMSKMFQGCRNVRTIYVGDYWTTYKISKNYGEKMFSGDNMLCGSKGTCFFQTKGNDYNYAKLDGGEKSPGYFSRKGDSVCLPIIPYTIQKDSTITLYYGQDVSGEGIFNDEGVHSSSVNKVVFDKSFKEYKEIRTFTLSYCINLKEVVGFDKYICTDKLSLSNMFKGCTKLTTLDLSNLNIDNENTSLSYMFADCLNLNIVKLGKIKNVTDMACMFQNCNSLSSVELSSINTTNATSFASMFSDCRSLTALDMSNFNTANVTSMAEMFKNCSSLTTLDLSSFNTSKVTNMEAIFQGCANLKTIYVGQNWNTSAETRRGLYMFKDCKKLVGGKGSAYNDSWNADIFMAHIDCGSEYPGYLTSKEGTNNIVKKSAYVMVSYSMGKDYDIESEVVTCFYDANAYKYATPYFDENTVPSEGDIVTFVIPFNNNNGIWYASPIVTFDQSFKDYKPTSCKNMFKNCNKLKKIVGLEYLNTSEVTDMSQMFLGCSSLTSLDLKNFNTSNVTDMTGMFQDCSSLKSLDLRSFNTSKVTSMCKLDNKDGGAYDYATGMFKNCTSLEKLDLRGFDTKQITCMAAMFGGCTSLKELLIDDFNTSNVTSMMGMFYNCKSLEKLDLSTFNTSKVNAMNRMFERCTKLKEINLNNFNTDKVKTCQSMFSNCESLVELDLTSFAARSVDDQMFTNCPNLETVLIGCEWKGSVNSPFKGSDKLKGNILGKLTYIDKGYATFDNGTLTFHYATSSESIPASAYPLDTEIPGWSDKALKIEKVVFPKYFQYVRPTTLYGWFFNCRNLTEIEGLEYLNTEDVEDMGLMFAGCKNLVSLDLSNFNTQNVTSMKGMFGYYDKDEDKGYYCDKLETIFVGDNWTTKYTEDDKLFEGCKKLVGGLGSAYNEKNVSTDYAHIDGGKSSPGYLTYMPDEAHKTVAAIAMNALPKTEYIQGEPLFTTGGTIKVDYNNMTTDIIDLSNAEITGFDTEKVGNQVLVVTYYDKKTTYEINVKAKTITKLEVTTLPKTEYGIGEKINLDGGVLTISYSNNLSEKVALSQAKVSGYDPMKLGTQKLSVIYLQNETSFEVKVVEKPAQSIAVTTLPKVLYVEGDAFTAEGGIITITYDGGSKGESNLTNAKLSGFDPNKIGEQTIKVEYLGCETSYKVTVKELAYYNVTYKIDGEIYGEVERVKLGSAIIPREAPAKDGYTFSGWSKIPANMPDHDIEIVGSFTKDATPEDPTTPTSEISINSNVKIWSFDRTIVIENPGHDIQIVDINGRLVKTEKTDDSRIEIPMSASGIYIVKTVAKTQKVMLK